MEETIRGIDISTWQKKVNYKRLKEQGIEFAIIRCGYGKNISQKDNMFETHYKGCKEAGIKVGAYLYSYCDNISNAILEAKNCLEFIKGKDFELPIFYDLEDEVIRNLGKEAITQIAINFCEEISKSGFTPGIYANLNWFINYIDVSKVDKYKIWLAQWNEKHTAKFRVDYWQYTSEGQLEAIEGNVDMNICFDDFTKTVENVEKNVEKTKSNEELANEVIKGLWGNGQERKDRLTKAGYNYNEVQALVNQKLSKKSNEELANEVIKGLWGNGQERKDRLIKAGYNYNEVQALVNQKMKK